MARLLLSRNIEGANAPVGGLPPGCGGAEREPARGPGACTRTQPAATGMGHAGREAGAPSGLGCDSHTKHTRKIDYQPAEVEDHTRPAAKCHPAAPRPTPVASSRRHNPRWHDHR
eukprot:SAG25_NODE_407_length_8435_cov_46.995082_2_plen_115_part_00